MARLALNPNVLLSPVADGYVAFDPVEQRLYELNPLAALLVELCDGVRDRDDVARLVAPLAPAATGDSIQRWLDEATANGLLTEPAESEDERPVAAGELDAPCLAELASRLARRQDPGSLPLPAAGRRTVP